MPEVTYIEFNGTPHRVEVPLGTDADAWRSGQ